MIEQDAGETKPSEVTETVAPSGEPPEASPVTSEPEPAVEPAAVQPDSVAKAFSALARDKRALRQREQAVKSLEVDAAFARSIREKAKSDPLGALRDVGIGIEDIARQAVPEDQATAQARELADLRARVEKAETARTQAEETARVASAREQVTAEVRKTPDKYEAVVALGHEHAVYDLMAELYTRTGEAPDFEQCAAAVEHDLQESVLKPAAALLAKRAKIPAGVNQHDRNDTSRATSSAPKPTISDRLRGEAAPGNGQSGAPFDVQAYIREQIAEFSR